MNQGALVTVAAWSYGIAAAGYLALALRIAQGWRRSPRAALLLLATLATATWAAINVAFVLLESPGLLLAANAADALRYGAWYGFVGNLLAATKSGGRPGERPATAGRWGYVLVALGLVTCFLLSGGAAVTGKLGLQGPRVEFGLRIGLAVFGLVLTEQLVRRAHPQARWAIKPLCIALAAIFGFDVFLYADSMLFGLLDPDIWIARGIANAMVIPFIAIATARNTGWSVEIHMSRGAIFHSTALLVSGVFLLAVAAAGYLVRYVGGDWSGAFQIELIFAAVLFVAVVTSSGRFRSKLKVFISKHFFSYRYDYREEWLRFTSTLSSESSVRGVQERIIMALANLVESPGGMLWLLTESRGFRPEARWNVPAVEAVEAEEDSLVTFLERTRWIIDLTERAATPAPYAGLELPPWVAAVKDAWLIIPLLAGTSLIGFIILTKSRAAVDVDWEVRDLLKTASQQAASYLGHLRATEALLETRKFDAFNRMSAFVVHDLKNLVAQLSLMLRNAERHRENPEFQRDMLATVKHVVERMNQLMLQLRTGTTPVESPRPVALEPVVRRVCAAKTDDDARIDLDLTPGVVTLGHEDQLEHVIGHLIQNALDATANGGKVSVRLHRDDRFATIEVADTGIGMSHAFIHERLFKPFETTKKAGMGIGVYESSQYITGLGGQMLVDSTPNVGTRVRVLLPLGDSRAAPSAPLKEVA
jgi:putative PEP-CTERM system histidine kinase